MEKYNIKITELLEKIVTIEANDKEEALEKVIKGYGKEEYILDYSNFMNVRFELL